MDKSCVKDPSLKKGKWYLNHGDQVMWLFFLPLQITMPYETQQLSKATKDTAAIYLACGVDTSKVRGLFPTNLWCDDFSHL